MKYFLQLLILIAIQNVFSQENKNFIDKTIDFLISEKSNQNIEFFDLYDNLQTEILEDDKEKLILVEKLKNRGFVIEDYGRGNYPPVGARIVIVKMRRKECKCEIAKIYYYTTIDNFFEIRERIKCFE